MIDRSISEHEKIKVLHLIDSGGLYGAEKVLLTLCSEQIKQGLEPTILSCGVPGEPSKAIELEAERLNIPCKSWRMGSGLNIKGMKEIWEWIHREGFTHLHSHGYKFNILLALTKRHADCIKLITTLHGYTSTRIFTKAGVHQLLDRLVLVRFDRICWVGAKNGISFWFKAINRDRIRYIKNGVIFKPCSNTRDQSKLEKMLIVGRLSSEKGVRYAIEALYELRSGGFDVSLTVAGDGPLRGELEALVKDLGMADIVEFLGFITDVYPLYESHDLLLIPSLTEGLPLVMLEAIGSGMPVIASSVGAIPEVLQEERFLVAAPVTRTSIVAKTMNWMRLNEIIRVGLIQSLSHRVRQEYSCEMMADNYRCLYEGLNAEV